MMRTMAAMAVVVTTAMSAAGCLVEDKSSTWYVAADGSVTWSVLERDVRSNAAQPGDRADEERVYLAAVHANTDDVAAGLRELGPASVDRRVVRDVAPFSLVTDAKFRDLGSVGQAVLIAAHMPGSSELTRTGDDVVWRFMMRDPHAEDTEAGGDDALASVLTDLPSLRVVLADGRFTRATGFTLDTERRIATVEPDSVLTAMVDARGWLTFELAWSPR